MGVGFLGFFVLDSNEVLICVFYILVVDIVDECFLYGLLDYILFNIFDFIDE